MTTSADFLENFARVVGTGSFHSCGTLPFFLPEIRIEGFGELAFPLQPGQAKDLLAFAEAAPYGHGEKTIMDEKVRKCGQIDASQLTIKARPWPAFLKDLAEQISHDLGIEGRISLHLYKLLLYGKGGHFRAHRDTEKLGAMIGSLIVALPSAHEGGDLCIRHDGREVKIAFSDEAHRHEYQYAAFFADCEHEVQQVRSGYRCCLAFNIRLEQGDPKQLNLPLTEQSRALLPSVTALKNDRAGELTAVLLEHQYTEANISWHHLKGNDSAKARALAAAGREVGCVVHLALVTLHQSGTLDEDYYRHSSSYYDDDIDPEDGTMGEVYEEALTISDWRDVQDRPAALGSYVIAEDDLLTDEAIDADDPDKKEAEGPTGNAGCTMDYWYHRAAIVLWAQEDDEGILCRYNLNGAALTLEKLAQRDQDASGSRFRRLAEAIIPHCPEARPHHHGDNSGAGNPFVVTVRALAMAGAEELFQRLASSVPAAAFQLCDTATWKIIHQAFGLSACEKLLDSTAEDETASLRKMLFDLLDSLRTKPEAASLVQHIVDRLVVLGPKPKPLTYGCFSQPTEPAAPSDSEEIRILLAVSHFLKNVASRQATRSFLEADRSLIYLRERLGPVLLDKSLATSFRKPNSLLPEILAFACGEIEAETKLPLNPYPDWSRPFSESDETRSPLIRELAAFMADPDSDSHRFKRAEGERSQIENFIHQHQLDLDCRTEKKSRPYSLICTKNDHSYDRKLAWRAQETELLEKLSQP